MCNTNIIYYIVHKNIQFGLNKIHVSWYYHVKGSVEYQCNSFCSRYLTRHEQCPIKCTGKTTKVVYRELWDISFSKVVATYGHACGSFNLFMATTGDVWIIPYFRIWHYVLHVEHVSCVITNCGQHQWVIPSHLSITLLALLEENITRKLSSLSLDFCHSRLLSLYYFPSLSFLLTFFRLVCNCSLRLYISPGN